MAHIDRCIPGTTVRIVKTGVPRVSGKTGTIVEVSRIQRHRDRSADRPHHGGGGGTRGHRGRPGRRRHRRRELIRRDSAGSRSRSQGTQRSHARLRTISAASLRSVHAAENENEPPVYLPVDSPFISISLTARRPDLGPCAAFTMLLGQLALAVPAHGQLAAPPPAAIPESTTVVAGPDYAAGGLHRWLFGKHYRTLWTTPIQVEVLDLGTFAGGLTPLNQGGWSPDSGASLFRRRREGVCLPLGQQGCLEAPPSRPARDVRRQGCAGPGQCGAPGWCGRWRLGSPGPPASGTVSRHWCISRMTRGWASSAASSPAWSASSKSSPTTARTRRSPGPGALDIVGTDSLYKIIEMKEGNYVDSEQFLRARLLDLFLGDWDRPRDRWRWAKVTDGDRIPLGTNPSRPGPGLRAVRRPPSRVRAPEFSATAQVRPEVRRRPRRHLEWPRPRSPVPGAAVAVDVGLDDRIARVGADRRRDRFCGVAHAAPSIVPSMARRCARPWCSGGTTCRRRPTDSTGCFPARWTCTPPTERTVPR